MASTPEMVSGLPRASTWVGFPYRKTESFYLPPETSRSFSARDRTGWDTTSYEELHRGKLGAFGDFISALYHETPVLAPLIGRLMRLLGLGVKAYMMLLRLTLFAFALSPAISKVGYWWWRSKSISRGVQYGKNPRNFLDVYHVIDQTQADLAPVVIYVTGGAWIIGYKAWAAPLGDFLSRNGIVTVSVDYRNFPQGTFAEMAQDVERAIEWTFANIWFYGGDPNNVTIVGQSAGAHITAYILLKRALDWNIRNFVGVSGPYDIVSLAPILNKRGLYTRMLKSIMNEDYFAVSPTWLVPGLRPNLIAQLPPILLLHGTADASVPVSSSIEFHAALQRVGVANVSIELWPGVAHSEPIVEAPVLGNNYLSARIAELCNPAWSAASVTSKPIMNEPMVRFAKYIMPF